MNKTKPKHHTPESIVRKLRDTDVMLNTGQSLAVVLQAFEVSELTLERWRT